MVNIKPGESLEFEKDINVQELVKHFAGRISKKSVSSTTKE